MPRPLNVAKLCEKSIPYPVFADYCAVPPRIVRNKVTISNSNSSLKPPWVLTCQSSCYSSSVCFQNILVGGTNGLSKRIDNSGVVNSTSSGALTSNHNSQPYDEDCSHIVGPPFATDEFSCGEYEHNNSSPREYSRFRNLSKSSTGSDNMNMMSHQYMEGGHREEMSGGNSGNNNGSNNKLSGNKHTNNSCSGANYDNDRSTLSADGWELTVEIVGNGMNFLLGMLPDGSCGDGNANGINGNGMINDQSMKSTKELLQDAYTFRNPSKQQHSLVAYAESLRAGRLFFQTYFM